MKARNEREKNDKANQKADQEKKKKEKNSYDVN
jgi:hypothetical protein